MRSVLILLLLSAGCASAVPSRADLTNTVAAFAQAFRSGDYDRVSEGIARDYVHVNGNAAPIDRDTWLAWYWGFAAEIQEGSRRFDQYELVDVQVAWHGDAAIVTGVVEATGVSEGGPFEQRIRVSNTWVVENGRWKRAAFHDVAIPRAP